MSTETVNEAGTGILNTTPKRVVAGVVAGFVGSLIFGAVMQTMMRGTLEAAIPAMYGFEPSLAVGWLFHQWHGVFLGALYVVAVDNVKALRDKARTLVGAVGLGVVYGVATTALPVIVMPLWLSAVGFPEAPPFPNVGFPATLMSAVNHIIYALPVTLAYWFVSKDG